MHPPGHNGGACACLARLTARLNRALDEATLIERYLVKYEFWKDRPGITDTAMVCDIARDLGLAKSAQVLRRYERVVDCVHHTSVTGVLVFTEKAYTSEGYVVPRYDCGLVEEMTMSGFRLWMPEQGQMPSVRAYVHRDWDILLAHALVFA